MDDRDNPEKERRQPRRASLSLAQILDAFERDAERHLSAGATPEDDLISFEKRAGIRLPASFRAFLARFGGGLYYHGHEIFGPSQVFIHDIELVPDLLSLRRWLIGEGHEVPAGLLPIHRARGAVHLLDVVTCRVLSLGRPDAFPDLAGFLEAIVLPRIPR